MADLRETARNPQRDFVQATPRNPVLGFLSDIVGASYSPQRTQQMQGLARMFSAPAISETLNRLSYGEPLTTGAGGIGGTTRVRPEVAEAGLALTDFLPTSAAAKTAAFAAPALAGIFIGPKAKTWDALAAQKAKILADMGTDPRTIWQQTGTWKGPDGKWRQEISDVPATLLNKQKNFDGKLFQTLDHPELFNNYPGLQYYDTEITSEIALPDHLKKTLIGRGSGSFTEKNFPSGEPKITAQAYSPEDKSTLLHELQHAVQAKEGFARGGSPSNFVDYTGALERARKNNGIDPVTGDADFVIEAHIKKFGVNPFEAYQRLAGEAEARAVQKRRNLSSEQRSATFPEESYDIPLNELIVR